jgi:protoporphyrinogen oxidase
VAALIAEGERKHVVIMGAGPAGLTAAYELMKRDVAVTVVEKDPKQVGGLARTVEHNGYRFDIGGHRFFSKNQEVEDLWTEILGDEMLTRGRLSRIYYRGRFFAYPIKAANALWNLGPIEALRCVASYAWARVHPIRNPRNLEDWVRNQFGQRLFSIFFKTYTEKVWGISTKDLSADWAAQRIKSLDLWVVLRTALLPQRKAKGRGEIVTTLIDRFRYPRLGPGQMWERMQERVESSGIPVQLNHRALSIRHEHNVVNEITVEKDGTLVDVPVDAVLSSIPLSELILRLDPQPPDDIVEAAHRLRYRSLCLVALVIDDEQPFPDNWIYLHDPDTRAGRVQNFGAWSPDMVKPGTTCLGAEYFCFEGDEIWEMSDEDAVKLTTDELARIGLVNPADVVDGVKVRVPKAYPMYDPYYREAVAVIHGYLAGFENLKTFGRNGLHRYNNQDHSMWTAILATLNLLDGTNHDVWAVNTEAEYHEEGKIVDELLDIELVGR